MLSNSYIDKQKLIWRSTRRAWLEIDICFSRFLEKNSLDSLSDEELNAYSYLVSLEDAELMPLFQGIEEVENSTVQHIINMIRSCAVS